MDGCGFDATAFCIYERVLFFESLVVELGLAARETNGDENRGCAVYSADADIDRSSGLQMSCSVAVRRSDATSKSSCCDAPQGESVRGKGSQRLDDDGEAVKKKRQECDSMGLNL